MTHLALSIAIASIVGAPHTNPPICLAPPSAQWPSTNSNDASAALGEVFKGYLTGPTLSVTPLTAKLPSQAREEARRANCKFVLFVTAKLEHKSETGGVLGKVGSRAVQEAAWGAGFETSNAAKRVAAFGASGAARAAADIAATTKLRDELELSYRLESESGTVLKEDKAKRKAKSDGEDILTPLAEHAAEEIAAIVSK
jgi:CelD/BcsL family acetyltransferase involved in cellulose biosynthesis